MAKLTDITIKLDRDNNFVYEPATKVMATPDTEEKRHRGPSEVQWKLGNRVKQALVSFSTSPFQKSSFRDETTELNPSQNTAKVASGIRPGQYPYAVVALSDDDKLYIDHHCPEIDVDC